MYAVAAWLILLSFVAVLEAAGRANGGFAAPSRIVARLGRSLAGRILLVAIWGFVGWHVFARYTIGPL